MTAWAADMADSVREYVEHQLAPLRKSLTQSDIKMATQLHLQRQEVERLIAPLRTETAELRSSVVGLLGRIETELTAQKHAFAGMHAVTPPIDDDTDPMAALADYVERELSHG